MEKSESDSSSKSEEEKVTETSLKTSDLKKMKQIKYFIAYTVQVLPRKKKRNKKIILLIKKWKNYRSNIVHLLSSVV